MVCVVVTTAVAGGGAEVVTTLVLGPRFLMAPQTPTPRQQQMHTGIKIGSRVQIRTRITATTTPAAETNHIIHHVNHILHVNHLPKEAPPPVIVSKLQVVSVVKKVLPDKDSAG